MVRLTDRPDITLDVYRGRKTTMQQQQLNYHQIFPLSRALCTELQIRWEFEDNSEMIIKEFLDLKGWMTCNFTLQQHFSDIKTMLRQ